MFLYGAHCTHLAGLDAFTRSSILELLHEVHVNRSPRLILGSRIQDGVPEWISNVAFVESARPGEPWSVRTGTRGEILEVMEKYLRSASSSTSIAKPQVREDGKILVDIRNVCVSYHGRDVSFSCPLMKCRVKCFWVGAEQYELDHQVCFVFFHTLGFR
jgi:hypothetical protein